MTNIELGVDQSAEVEAGSFKIVTKHNDVGISIDVYFNDNLVAEHQHWQDDYSDDKGEPK